MKTYICGAMPGSVKADGFAFAGEANWKALQKTPYIMDPMVDGVYVTTAAVAGQDLKLAKEPPPAPVKTYDLSPEMQAWVGGKEGAYACEIKLDLRVGPDGNCDTVERLTNLRGVWGNSLRLTGRFMMYSIDRYIRGDGVYSSEDDDSSSSKPNPYQTVEPVTIGDIVVSSGIGDLVFDGVETTGSSEGTSSGSLETGTETLDFLSEGTSSGSLESEGTSSGSLETETETLVLFIVRERERGLYVMVFWIVIFWGCV